ncbi:MAG: pseudouridine synthase [Anaerorhabdus sp.]|uniref:pseudouridine synthase n=1 Tax=Anaerorhabdus sp. TaxID=1872524 RepID=UPI002FC993B1
MMRLDKCLCHLGYGTRKDVKKVIRSGVVSINGIVCKKEDTKFDEENDQLMIDGIDIIYQKFVYIMLNKPQGVISATEDGLHETVLNCIQDTTKGLFPVGRLDIDTEGLILLTNDGQLAHDLLSPKKHVDKTYYVEISEPLSKESIELIEKGITIDGDELCKPAKVKVLSDKAIELTITEGKFHQVKRMILACQSEVTYLKRISMGSLQLDEELELGQWRYLTNDELESLMQ